MSIVTLIFVQLASGLDFITSLSAIIAASTMRDPAWGWWAREAILGLERFPDLVCSAAMLLGRLEVSHFWCCSLPLCGKIEI